MDFPVHQRELDAAQTVVGDARQSENLMLARTSGRTTLMGRLVAKGRLRFSAWALWPHNGSDQRSHVGLGGVERAHVGAVAQNSDAVGDAEHLVEAMGHIDDADVLPDDRRDSVEQDLLFVARQR